jgi:hypothetical protein
MCDLAYVNLLREKVRQQEAEEKRARNFSHTSSLRFVPWIFPAQSVTLACSERSPTATDGPISHEPQRLALRDVEPSPG